MLFRKKTSPKISQDLIEKTFTLKNPAPLQRFIRDMLGVEPDRIAKPYQQSIWVYRAINILSRIAQVKCAMTDTKGNPVERGPEAFLLNSPNSYQSLQEIIELWSIYMATTGNAFLLREDGTNYNGIPRYVTMVNPARMTYDEREIDALTGQPEFWRLKINDWKEMRIDARGVVHWMLPNPYSMTVGLSPLDALRITVDAEFAARIHNKYQMQKHGRIAGIVSFKDRVDREKLAMLKTLFDAKYAGNDKAGETLLMDNDARYQQMSLSAKDMDWLEGQRISREEICAAYGIPPNVAGILDRATYSNYEQASRTLWEETLIPLGTRFTDKLNRTIFSKSVNKVKFSFQDIRALQRDERERAEIYQILVHNKITPERAAELAGIELGQVMPEHREIWITGGEMTASTMTAEPEPVPPPEKEIKFVERIVEVQDHTETKIQLRLAQAKNIERDALEFEKPLDKILKSYFYAQRKSVLEQAQKVEEQLKSVKALSYTADELVDKWLSEKDWDRELIDRTRPIFVNLAKQSGIKALKEIGTDPAKLRLDTMDGFFRQQSILLRKVNDYTREALLAGAKTLAENTAAGVDVTQTMEQLRTDLKGVFNNTESRRRTIARTETLRTVNGSRFEQMKAAGVSRIEWLAVMDSETRDDHRALDGQIIEMGQVFKVGVKGEHQMDTLAYPLDPSAPARQTVNCRCVIAASFDHLLEENDV